jgi:hypothetical protein
MPLEMMMPICRWSDIAKSLPHFDETLERPLKAGALRPKQNRRIAQARLA